MSKSLSCLKENVSFNPSQESGFVCDSNPKPKNDIPDSPAQDENKPCTECTLLPFTDRSQSRKREAPNILGDSVKRRDFNTFLPSFDFMNGTDCFAITPKNACGSTKIDLLEVGSFTDSGIESSKSSPSHSDDFNSLNSLQDNSHDFMEIDNLEIPATEPAHDGQEKTKSPVIPPSLTSSSVPDQVLEEVTISQKDSSSITLKSPFISSLFEDMPSLIYFSTKDEAVEKLPDEILSLLKWRSATISPAVVKDAVLKAGFQYVPMDDDSQQWLGTWGKHINTKIYRTYKSFQKVNHYPGSFHMGRKDRIWENYQKMRIQHGTDEYNFFPDTYILPADLKLLKSVWDTKNSKCWIAKPCASARGLGIRVIHKWSQVPKSKPFLVQHYISDPYLINGNKFDLRLYVIVPSIEPLRIYVFDDGLVRFASEKYSQSNKSFKNRFIHLTNYSVQRKSEAFISNDDENACHGHKWSLKSFWTYMAENGVDIVKIQDSIMDIIIKTVISAESNICRFTKLYAKSLYNCFELFGFDVLLDKDLHPWLLEVNVSPSLHTKSSLDWSVKRPLVRDTFNIAGFEVPDVSSPIYKFLKTNRHKAHRGRILTIEEQKKHSKFTLNPSGDILDNLTMDDLCCLFESEDEFNRKGQFRRIFPSTTSCKYFEFFEHRRYYNMLLDAWEQKYGEDRSTGISHLREIYSNLKKTRDEELNPMYLAPQVDELPIEPTANNPDPESCNGVQEASVKYISMDLQNK